MKTVLDILKHYKGEMTMSRYENHADEWREEENERKAERDAARRNYYIPGDPRYIAPEESRRCDECGTSIDELSTGQTVCFECIKELDLDSDHE